MALDIPRRLKIIIIIHILIVSSIVLFITFISGTDDEDDKLSLTGFCVKHYFGPNPKRPLKQRSAYNAILCKDLFRRLTRLLCITGEFDPSYVRALGKFVPKFKDNEHALNKFLSNIIRCPPIYPWWKKFKTCKGLGKI